MLTSTPNKALFKHSLAITYWKSQHTVSKILSRAGATIHYREDGSEWWHLPERMDEFIEKKQDTHENN